MTPEPEVDEPEIDVSIEVVLVCATCGRPLTGDPDEDATGDAGQPICGECSRERDFFALDAADGTLDGQIR